ncbi:hypothetical protein MMC25_007308 [Agyrium rufum]|nr:hypothetical protein [Agyrium rufum]
MASVTSASPPSTSPSPVPPSYKPTIPDVLAVKRLLSHTSLSLPTELISQILDHAYYWPHIKVSRDDAIGVYGRVKEHVFSHPSSPLPPPKTLPEPTLAHPARRIIFTFISEDHGSWREIIDTRGTYSPSCTGFDARLERFYPARAEVPSTLNPDGRSAPASTDFAAAWPGQTPPPEAPVRDEDDHTPETLVLHPESAHYAQVDPPIWPRTSCIDLSACLQRNLHERLQLIEHRVVWDWKDDGLPGNREAAAAKLTAIGRGEKTGDGKFVRSMKVGDCVAVWAWAIVDDWANHVERVDLEVYFAI